MKVNTILKNQCSRCGIQTNHIVKSLQTVIKSDDDIQFSCKDEFAIVQCLGCETFSFRKEYSDSDNIVDNEEGYGEEYVRIDTYPLALKGHKKLKDAWRLPQPIGLMYHETIAAFAANSKVLAGAGCRAIIEAVCLDKEIKSRNLQDKINSLAKNGFITIKERDRLHSIRFIGNDSIHEMKEPKEEQLNLVLYIIEHLLSNLYLIDLVAKSKLESVLSTYQEFKAMLSAKVKLKQPGLEYSIFELFGKDFRRINNYHLFEQDLMKEIKSGDYKLLTVGASKPNPSNPRKQISHFVIV